MSDSGALHGGDHSSGAIPLAHSTTGHCRDATSDSYGCQQELNPGLQGEKSTALTTEPRLLLTTNYTQVEVHELCDGSYFEIDWCHISNFFRKWNALDDHVWISF